MSFIFPMIIESSHFLRESSCCNELMPSLIQKTRRDVSLNICILYLYEYGETCNSIDYLWSYYIAMSYCYICPKPLGYIECWWCQPMVIVLSSQLIGRNLGNTSICPLESSPIAIVLINPPFPFYIL